MTMMMKMQNQDWPPSRIFTSNYNFPMGFSVSLACVQPSPPPFPSGKIGEGPLLRFFLREGAGGRGLYTGYCSLKTGVLHSG